MKNYYLTGTSTIGQRLTQAIPANSVVEARQKLVDQGWTDIVVHSDDVSTMNQVDTPNTLFSPEEMIRLGSLTSFQFFILVLKKLYRICFLTNALGVLMLGFGVQWHSWAMITIGAVFLLLPGAIAISWASRRGDKPRYDALVTAACWYRWEEVERLLPLQSPHISAEERAYRTAQVIAGRGNAETAIQYYETAVADRQLPQWFSLTRQVPLLLIAQKAAWAAEHWTGFTEFRDSSNLDHAIRKYEQVIELAPDQATPMIDYAKLLLKYRRDVPRARRLLESAKNLVQAELVSIFAVYAQGIIALEENSVDEAVRLLSEFPVQFRRLGSNPAIDAVIDESSAFLTLAYALAGKDEQAHKQFRRCEPRLIATNELELLARCRTALRLNQH